MTDRARRRRAVVRMLVLLAVLVGTIPAAATAVASPVEARILAAVADPQGLSATVTWDPAAGGAAVTGWRVARDGVDSAGYGPWIVMLAPGEGSMTFRYLNPWDTYVLSVAPVTADGVGPASARTVTLEMSTPSPPRQVTAAAGVRQVRLAWQPPEHTGAGPVTGYRVRRFEGDRTDAATALYLPADARDATFPVTDRGFYRFDVAALNGRGAGRAGARTGMLQARTAPSAPLVASWVSSMATRTVTLLFSPPYDDGGSPVVGYRVQRAGAEPQLLAPTARTWTVPGLEVGVPRAVSVRAVSALGDGPAAGQTVTLGAPSPPQRLTVRPMNEGLFVFWGPPADTGASTVLRYRIHVDRNNPSGPMTPVVTVTAAGTARSADVRGLVNGQDYRVAITAENAAGASPQAFGAPYASPSAVPERPTGVTATAQEPLRATVGWTLPLPNGTPPVTGQYVSATRFAADGVTPLENVFGGAVPGDATRLVMSLPRVGTYRFQVYAVNEIGWSLSSAWSPLVAVR